MLCSHSDRAAPLSRYAGPRFARASAPLSLRRSAPADTGTPPDISASRRRDRSAHVACPADSQISCRRTTLSRRQSTGPMLRLSLLTAVTAFACSPAVQTAPSPATSAHTLVAIFAHPDDETIVSPALAHYARNGTRVSAHAHIPAGDSLAKVRADDARCSARQLGAQPPVLLGFPDAGLAVLS